MSIRDVTNNMHRYIDELEAAVSGRCSDSEFQYAMKRFIMSTYSSLASLSFYGGSEDEGAQVFQDEAVPASEVVDSAFFKGTREAEYEAPARQQTYSTLNHRQQFGSIVEGASL